MWKTTNYELDTRVAMMCRVPGSRTAGAKTKALVELVDVYPSLVALAGLDVPGHCEGASIAPLMKDPQRSWKTAAFSQFSRGGKRGYAITDRRFRYVEWVDLKVGNTVVERELYDHAKDPDERRNVAGEAVYETEVKRLAKMLDGGKGWRRVSERMGADC